MKSKATLSQIAQLTRRIADGTYDRDTVQAILAGHFVVTTQRPSDIEAKNRDKTAFKLLGLDEQLDRLSRTTFASAGLVYLREAAKAMVLPAGADGFLVVEKHLGKTKERSAQPMDLVYEILRIRMGGRFSVNNDRGLALGMRSELIAYYERLEKQTLGDYLALPVSLGWTCLSDQALPSSAVGRRIPLNSYAMDSLIGMHLHLLSGGVSRVFKCLGDIPIVGGKPLVSDKDHSFESVWSVDGSRVTHDVVYRHDEDARLYSLAYFAPYIVLQ